MSRIEDALENANRKRENPVSTHAPVVADRTRRLDKKDVKKALLSNPCLVMLNGSDSPVAEEYKKLKSIVVRLTRKDQFKNTIMVTSALRAEGKSITSLNLAITLAQDYDNTVLLVDTDLRKPSVHKYLGIKASVGLTDCLTKGMDVGEAIVHTGIGKLAVLPAGKVAKNPVEMVMSGRMKSLVKDLKHRYADRYVIFDTPPLLPFAEVHALSAMVDGVILVVREGQTPVSSIKTAAEMLKGANVLGTVYNCANMDRFSGHGYYYYGYQNYYASPGTKRG